MIMRQAVTLLVVLLAGLRSASAQDPVTAIRNLYESAAYEDALSAIDRLSTDVAGSTERPARELLRYRALCLLALDRTADAEQVIQELIVDDPQYRPDAQASPRWVNAVGRVRSRVAPELVRSRYVSGKRHFDKKEFGPAASDFETVLTFLHNPSLEPSVVESLSDVATLSEGFLDLSRAGLKGLPSSAPAANAAAAKTAPASATAAKTAPENVAATAAPENAVQRTSAAANTPAGATPGRNTPQNVPPTNGAPATGAGPSVEPKKPAFYTAADAGVTLPGLIRQDLPPWRTGVRGTFVGQLDVLISESGEVESAELRTPVHPLYNAALLEAARHWQYKPAMKDGTPVRFLKTMIVNLGAN